MKEISSWVWNPADSLFKQRKSEKAIGHIFLCERHDSCELYVKGECVLCDMRCPYGSRSKEYGYSRRSTKFCSWIRDFKERHKNGANKPLSMPKKMVYFGEYVYLPISFLNLRDCSECVKCGGMIFDDKYILKKSGFTSDFIAKHIISANPRAFSGGIIESYQEENVPKFIMWLKELDKSLFNEVKNLFPDDKRFEFITNVGRTARLNSLTPNVGLFKDIHGGEWSWDGEYVTSTNSHASFCIIDTKFIQECKIKPTEDAIAKVTDDNQVNEHTEFID